MEFQSGLRNIVLAGFVLAGFVLVGTFLGLETLDRLENIADRLDTATIGGTRVPAVDCAEDEVISWLGVDRLGCVHFEDVR